MSVIYKLFNVKIEFRILSFILSSFGAGSFSLKLALRGTLRIGNIGTDYETFIKVPYNFPGVGYDTSQLKKLFKL